MVLAGLDKHLPGWKSLHNWPLNWLLLELCSICMNQKHHHHFMAPHHPTLHPYMITFDIEYISRKTTYVEWWAIHLVAPYRSRVDTLRENLNN